jgi:hypothetical protein
MSTTAMSTTALEEKLNRYRGDYAAHKRQGAVLSERLVQVKKEREEPAHLERIVAGNHDAIRLDDKLAKEQVGLEREINAREKLAAGSRRAAEELQPQIDQAHVGETVERAAAIAVGWENEYSAGLAPIFEYLVAEVQKYQAGRLALESATLTFPEWALAWLGRYFFQNVDSRIQSSLLAEVTRIVGGKNSSAEFVKDTIAIFRNVERAFATIGRTAARGGKGSQMYRSIGNINGISGGLNLRDGDLVCLLVDDGDTRKMLASGALEPVEEAK